ncbi:DUF3054 domain-containing protein [Corynebacterium sp. UMB10321]|uniref:DUF3054 domain-containing protein n=2 Tax=Corynebacterium TaxID=1716 RepID=UPI0030155BDD
MALKDPTMRGTPVLSALAVASTLALAACGEATESGNTDASTSATTTATTEADREISADHDDTDIMFAQMMILHHQPVPSGGLLHSYCDTLRIYRGWQVENANLFTNSLSGFCGTDQRPTSATRRRVRLSGMIKKPYAIAADYVAIAAFALLARIAHQTEEMPLNFFGWLETFLPFAVGLGLAWLATRKDKGWLIWLITIVVGLIIWGFYRHKLPHYSFVIVASSMSALLMLGWRGAAKLILKRR